MLLLVLQIITLSVNANVTTAVRKIDSIPSDSKDVATMDGILAALYDVISGPAGQSRNWDRMRTLFIPEAKLIPTGKRQDGSFGKRVFSLEDYINISGPVLEKNGFFESEIGRTVDQYGNIVSRYHDIKNHPCYNYVLKQLLMINPNDRITAAAVSVPG